MENTTSQQRVVLSDTLTDEEKLQLDEAAAEICKAVKASKIHVYVAIKEDTKERIVAFIREPSFMQKIAVMDKISTAGSFIAGNDLRETCLLKEHSHALTYGTENECEQYKLGVNGFCLSIIEVAKNEYKKK